MWLLAVVAVLGLLGDGGSAAIGPDHLPFETLARKRVPRRPDREIEAFQCFVVTGKGSFVPQSWADRPTLHMSSRDVWVIPPGTRPRVDLDPTALRLDNLSPAPDAGGAIKDVDTDCHATVSGPNFEIVIEGPWFAIAWLGHLAGWADPAAA